MNAAVMEIPIAATQGFLERSATRLFRELSENAEDWSLMVNGLHRFEDAELLDNPHPDKLAIHRNTLLLLISFGTLIENATKQEVYPFKDTQKMVSATLQMLKDDLALWHGNSLSESAANEIMAKCFPA